MQTRMLAGYDVAAAANTNDISLIETEKTQATSEKAASGETKQQEIGQEIQNALVAQRKASEKFGEAGRRQVIKTLGMADYITNVFQPIADAMEAQNTAMNAESVVMQGLETQNLALQQEYAARLNEMSAAYGRYKDKRQTFEKETAIYDFATTPYITSGAAVEGEEETDVLEDRAVDAESIYNLALIAYENAQAKMKDASVGVALEDKHTEFEAILDKIDADPAIVFAPLSATEQERYAELIQKYAEGNRLEDAAEQTEYAELRERDIYNRYKDLIDQRREHIKQTLRMVRVEKAKTIVNAEIARLEAETVMKHQAYQSELDLQFGGMSGTGQEHEDNKAARNAVYQYLRGQMEGGMPAFNVYRAWYYGGMMWSGPGAKTLWDAGATGLATPMFGIASVLEILGGQIDSANTPADVQQNVAQWLGNGGSMAEFNAFQGTYYSMVMGLMTFDQKMAEMVITLSTMLPLIISGYALMATLFGFAAGFAQVQIGTTAIISKQFEVLLSGLAALWGGMAVQSVSHYESVEKVKKNQLAYEESKAKLDYVLLKNS